MTSAFQTPEQSPGFLLWRATLAWQRAITRALEPFGLTHVQFVLLASLWWLGTLGERPSQRQLADHAGTDVMMTSQVCRALEAKGLIRRSADPTDSRAYRLRATRTGRSLAARAIRSVEVVDEAFFRRAPRRGTTIELLSSLADTPKRPEQG